MIHTWSGRRRVATPLLLLCGLLLAACTAELTPAVAATPPVLAVSAPLAAPDGLQVLAATAAPSTVHRRDAAPAPGSEIPTPLKLAPILFGMTALTKDRNAPSRDRRLLPYLVGAAKKIYAGSIVVLNAGYAQAGSTATGLIAVGRAREAVDNSSGAAGALSVTVERGVFLFANDGTIAQADVGATCYIVDDQTVAKTNGSSTRSAAGTIRGVESGGVWVEI